MARGKNLITYRVRKTSAISARNKVLNIFRKSKLQNDLINFKKFRAKARTLLRFSEKQSWNSFVASTNHLVSSSSMWSRIKRLTGPPRNHTFQPLVVHDQPHQTPPEICEILASTYAHISSDDNYDLEFLPHKTSVESAPINFSLSPSPLFYNLPISEEEVR